MSPNADSRVLPTLTGVRCRVRRPRGLAWILAALLATMGTVVAQDADNIVVENWSRQPAGQQGVPEGWQKQNWAARSTTSRSSARARTAPSTCAVTTTAPRSRRRSPSTSSATRSCSGAGRWSRCPRAATRQKETDDEAAQLYVTFPRFPSALRSRIIGYIWDTTAPADSVFPSKKVGTVRFLVVRSGDAELNKWITERRNVLEDFELIYGEVPKEDVGRGIHLDQLTEHQLERRGLLRGDPLQAEVRGRLRWTSARTSCRGQQGSGGHHRT
jgi:Protein of unknown function (DUF3047)